MPLAEKERPKGGRKYDEEFKTPVFLTAKNLNPFISNDLIENLSPIHFFTPKGGKSIGYKAELLPAVCNLFIDAQEAGALEAVELFRCI